jgi:CRISPR-associated protein Cas1
MLKGRLGLDTARVPHSDRAGLLWLGRGRLTAEDGTLHFVTAGDGDLPAGAYDIPYQTVSCIVMQPGCTVSHDAMRLLSRHGTALVCTGQDGVRLYSAMPFGPDDSRIARRQATWWADKDLRVAIARRMYALRLGEILPQADMDTLRGIEGSRAKATYRLLAQQHGIDWRGRNYDRQNPDGDDIPNQAINHASTAVVAAAQVATAAIGAVPQLGFIHEDSGHAFCLDIADLYRDAYTVPIAFAAARKARDQPHLDVEREVRLLCGREFRRGQLISQMIEKIQLVLRADTLDPRRPEELDWLFESAPRKAAGQGEAGHADDRRGHQ